jgi:molecular chaperone GrpE (heat shock protein)
LRLGVCGTTFEAPRIREVLMLPATQTTWNHDDPTAEAEVDLSETTEREPDRATMVQALRDLEAAKGRVERDAKRVHDDTREQLVAKLLPVLDGLDRAIRAGIDHGDAPAALEGVRLVRSQLEGVLRGYGAERIDAKDQAFDPVHHDAVSVVPVSDPRGHGRVLDQLEAGYKFGDRLLRPAKVVVGRYTQPVTRAPRWY